MRRSILEVTGIAGAFACLVATGSTPLFAAPREASDAIAPAPAVMSTSLAKLPLHFEPNLGQTDSRVRFLARGNGFALFLTGSEAVLSLRSGSGRTEGRAPSRPAVVRLRLLGRNHKAAVEGLEALPGRSHYLRGYDPGRWRTNVPQYGRVRYRSVYPGIDVEYCGRDGRLEYDFLVAAGADPARIRLRVDGGEGSSLRVDEEGHLVIRTSTGEVVQRRPVIRGAGPGHLRWRVRGRLHRQVLGRLDGGEAGILDRRRHWQGVALRSGVGALRSDALRALREDRDGVVGDEGYGRNRPGRGRRPGLRGVGGDAELLPGQDEADDLRSGARGFRPGGDRDVRGGFCSARVRPCRDRSPPAASWTRAFP